MWVVSGLQIQMAEGDYGVLLPVTISGATFDEHDVVRVTFKTDMNGETILEKDYNNLSENTFNIELTEAESSRFPVGWYCYSIDWYQDGNFLCNIVPYASFRVVDKA